MVPELRRTLVTGGDGYCDHDALRGHSDRAGAFVEHIQEVGRRWEPNSRHRDVVHWDLHPGNVLAVDGRCTAVIDSEFARVGDAGFDLVLLAVTAAEHRMQPGSPTGSGPRSTLRWPHRTGSSTQHCCILRIMVVTG